MFMKCARYYADYCIVIDYSIFYLISGFDRLLPDDDCPVAINDLERTTLLLKSFVAVANLGQGV
jgi:hypothetical protein